MTSRHSLLSLAVAASIVSTGAAVGLYVGKSEAAQLPAIIGILMLMGIVTKNSILLVEYALVEVGKGVARSTAVIDACSKRAQPIVMTTPTSARRWRLPSSAA